MPSESIAELPVKKAAINLVAAMARLPAIAAKIAVLDSVLMLSVRTTCGSGRLILESDTLLIAPVQPPAEKRMMFQRAEGNIRVDRLARSPQQLNTRYAACLPLV